MRRERPPELDGADRRTGHALRQRLGRDQQHARPHWRLFRAFPAVISVLIPVKNGGDDLARCLERINAQRLDEDVEIVVVDSGSTDGSVQAALQAGARVHEIPPEEFDHGSTRNLAASLAQGETFVFTSQDAYAE